jgi:hypothetical protein
MPASSTSLTARLATWVPVLVLYALILATVPIGRVVSLSLYRVASDPVTERVALPGPAIGVRSAGGGILALLDDGRLWWRATDGSTTFVDTPAPCLELGYYRNGDRILCPMGRAGLVAVDVGDGPPRVSPWEVGGEATAAVPSGTRAAVGRSDGVVELWLDDVRVSEVDVGEGPVRDLLFIKGTMAVSAGDALVIVDLLDLTRPAVVGSLPLGAPAMAIDRASAGLHLVLTPGAVVTVDLRVKDTPREVRRAATPGVGLDLRTVLESVTMVLVQDQGVQVLRDPGLGFTWWGPHWGERTTAVACGGHWGEALCATTAGEVVRFDLVGSRNLVVVAVGGLAILGVLALLGSFVVLRPRGWPTRLAWTVGGLVGIGWLLSASLNRPIEALHIFEYGVLGAMLFRAIAREGGTGLAAAVLGVCLGYSAGLFDESLQWLHPERVGAIDDVMLDSQAAGVGVFVGWLGLRFGEGRRPIDWRLSITFVAVLLPLTAAFLHGTSGFSQAHSDGDLHWISQLSREELRLRDAEPGTREAIISGATLDYSDFRERFADDAFIYEMRVHVFRRDQRYAKGDLAVACGEERLIQLLYPASLDDTPFEWSAAQRAECAALGPERYDSPVGGDRITSFTAVQLWTVTIVLTAGLVLAVVFLTRRRRAGVAGGR